MNNSENPEEVKFEGWKDLVASLAGTSPQGWVFRGLPNSNYHLYSKLERILQEIGISTNESYDAENHAIGFFQERARHFLDDLPNNTDLLSWLALMQHYGAPTRLTDWTVSPFVACYFAFEQQDKDSDSAALWMLNANLCRNMFGTKFPIARDYLGVRSSTAFSEGQQIEKSYPWRDVTDSDVAADENLLLRQAIEGTYEWPLPLPILRPDRRMAAQQACFVASGKLSTKEEPAVVELLPSTIIRKVRLPYEWRSQALQSLAMMNITADTLFPGLDGVGKTTELFMKFGAPVSLRQYLGL